MAFNRYFGTASHLGDIAVGWGIIGNAFQVLAVNETFDTLLDHANVWDEA